MAQFIGRVQGTRGEVSRLGHKTTGLTASASGWNIGATVEIAHKDGKDVVRVYKTSGSGQSQPSELIAEFSE